MPIREWKPALNHFTIVFEDQLKGISKSGSYTEYVTGPVPLINVN